MNPERGIRIYGKPSMSYELSPIFAVPFAQDVLPDAPSINTLLRRCCSRVKPRASVMPIPTPSLKQHASVFESDLNLFSWPETCVQQLRQFATLGCTVQ